MGWIRWLVGIALVVVIVGGAAIVATIGDDSDQTAITPLESAEERAGESESATPTSLVVSLDGDTQEPGRRCYEFNADLIVYLRFTINDDQSMDGEGLASINGGATFDHRQQFEGEIVRGRTANLDVITLSEDQELETRESWTFVDRGLSQGSRIYDQVDCSTVDPTFEDDAGK